VEQFGVAIGAEFSHEFLDDVSSPRELTQKSGLYVIDLRYRG